MKGATLGERPYLIGIGGCGLSALARLLAARGCEVSGSDASPSSFTDGLLDMGVPIWFDQTVAIPEGVDCVIASAAIKPDHPQILGAQERGLPVYTYPEALGRAMESHTSVAIAGTHGKSTTTAMLGCALARAGLDPSVIVGASSPGLSPDGVTPTNFRLGAGIVPAGARAGAPGLLLAEACEYNRSFHNYAPSVGAIMNVEADHLDIYRGLDEIVEAFGHFARRIPSVRQGGVLLISHDRAHRREIAAGVGARVLTVGYSPGADYCVRFDPMSRDTALARTGEGLVAAWRCPLPGEHNAMNSAFAASIAHVLGADMSLVSLAIGEFGGLERRMHLLGTTPTRVRVYDDYGHHPTEIESTLRALREHERIPPRAPGTVAERRLVCVFQPHQHSRTRHLMEEFASAFSDADVVIVPHIYFVRDSQEERSKVTASDLVDRLRQRGVHAMHLYPFEAIVEQLQVITRPGDVVVTMGAGPVDRVSKGYLLATRGGVPMPVPAGAHGGVAGHGGV